MKRLAIKTSTIFGITLIILGLILQYQEVLINYFFEGANNSSLNLSLAEIDTYYENSSSLDQRVTQMSNQKDLGWTWPTSTDYALTSYYSKYHAAIDIVPKNGDYNVYAASSGIIVKSSYKWDNGNYYVLKQDNGYYTLYCHLSQKIVQQGQRVEKGQVIGVMGRTGYATGVHLHYGVWDGYPHYGGRSINPLNFY